MVTITSKTLSEDSQYVLLSLSDGTEIAITADWATKFVQEPYTDSDGNLAYRDTAQSLLEYEIDQATVRAQQRMDDSATVVKAAQAIISS